MSLLLPPGRSVRPQEPAKSVSPEKRKSSAIRQPGEERIVLSVALSDPDTEAGMVGLLEGFCAEHPNVDPVLHIDPEAMCAVREKRADVGLCPETDVPGGLNCLTLTFPEGRSRQLIWNRSRKAGELARMMRLTGLRHASTT